VASAGESGWHGVRVTDRGDGVEVRGPKSPAIFFGMLLALAASALVAGALSTGEVIVGDPAGLVFGIVWTAGMVAGLVSALRVVASGSASGLVVGALRRRHLAWWEVASIDVPLLNWNGVSNGLRIRRRDGSTIRIISFALSTGKPSRAELYDVAMLLASLPERYGTGPAIRVRVEQGETEASSFRYSEARATLLTGGGPGDPSTRSAPERPAPALRPPRPTVGELIWPLTMALACIAWGVSGRSIVFGGIGVALGTFFTMRWYRARR
jgi:hypothetical protein